MRNRLMMRTMAAGRAGRLRVALALAVAGALSGCGGGSMFGASSDSSPSISDRFGQLFGSKSQAVGEAPPPAVDNELTCPSVSIRAGASTYAVAAPGKQAVGNDLRYQATITRTARDCNLNGGQITARIGIQGRVIAGPAGNPPTIEVPAVQSGGRRSGVSGTAGSDRRFLRLLYRIRSAGAEAGAEGRDAEEEVILLSSPGLTGRSSTLGFSAMFSNALEYWITRFRG